LTSLIGSSRAVLRRLAPLGGFDLQGRAPRRIPRGWRGPALRASVGEAGARGGLGAGVASWPPRRRSIGGRPPTQTERLAPLALVVVRILNELEHRMRVRAPLGRTVTTRELHLRCDRVLLKVLPHLLGVG
jgi:hypothetical protein